MTDVSTAERALVRAGSLATELANTYREVGFLKSQSITSSAAAFQQAVANGENITSCREHARQSVSHIESQIVVAEGNISALLVERHYIDQILANQ